MAIIKTYCGKDVLIDDDKYEEVKDFKIFCTNGYANIKYPNGKFQVLHRVLTNCPPDMVVDHLNRNKLDNRLENLEIVTHKENCSRNGKYLAKHGLNAFGGKRRKKK